MRASGRTDDQQNKNIQQRPPCGFLLVIFLEKKNAFSYTEKPNSIWDTAPKGEVFRGKTISHPVLFPHCPRAGLKSDYRKGAAEIA